MSHLSKVENHASKRAQVKRGPKAGSIALTFPVFNNKNVLMNIILGTAIERAADTDTHCFMVHCKSTVACFNVRFRHFQITAIKSIVT